MPESHLRVLLRAECVHEHRDDVGQQHAQRGAGLAQQHIKQQPLVRVLGPLLVMQLQQSTAVLVCGIGTLSAAMSGGTYWSYTACVEATSSFTARFCTTTSICMRVMAFGNNKVANLALESRIGKRAR